MQGLAAALTSMHAHRNAPPPLQDVWTDFETPEKASKVCT